MIQFFIFLRPPEFLACLTGVFNRLPRIPEKRLLTGREAAEISTSIDRLPSGVDPLVVSRFLAQVTGPS